MNQELEVSYNCRVKDDGELLTSVAVPHTDGVRTANLNSPLFCLNLCEETLQAFLLSSSEHFSDEAMQLVI